MIRPWVCRGVVALLLVVAFIAPTQAQSWEDGNKAYERGDYATALSIWKPFAERGDVTTQFNLGLMYQTGLGTAQDYGEAAKWYREAAEKGNAYAQVNLGQLYRDGTGIAQDFGEAVKWYRLAANRGNGLAQSHLGAMYAKGWGVIQDFVQAHMWLNLAAATLAPGKNRDLAAKNRDLVSGEMTPAQVAEAQQLAREWKPKAQ